MKQLLGIVTLSVSAFAGTLVVADSPAQPPKDAKGKVGLILNDPRAFKGYTLFAPGGQKKTWLIDMEGKVVNIWNCNSDGGTTYLLPNGHLLRTGRTTEKLSFTTNPPPGLAGHIQEYTWEGELVWDFKLINDKQAQHHDVCPMPNGNVLCIAWDVRSAKEVLDAGRVESLVGEMLPDSIIEIKKTGKTTAEVVWEWRLFDHLVQDYDKTKNNFGDVAAHPELVNFNFGSGALASLPNTAEGLQKLKAKGDGGKKGGSRVDDWTHCNAISYNADLDHVLVSVHQFSEFWVIDHSTTTAQAKGHTGGKSGKGGDLLFRWGNPAAYRAGTTADRQLFNQHNVHWIPKGLPGGGNILIFNNGGARKPSYTSIDEIVPPLGPDGKYVIKPGTAFGPEKPAWSYTAPTKTDFYATFISSAQRLPNGNTFICAGDVGKFFEVTPKNDIVWQYINPVGPAGGAKAGGKDKGTGTGKGGIAGTTVFRAYRVSPDFPGLAGKNLMPGKTIEEVLAGKDGKKG